MCVDDPHFLYRCRWSRVTVEVARHSRLTVSAVHDYSSCTEHTQCRVKWLYNVSITLQTLLHQSNTRPAVTHSVPMSPPSTAYVQWIHVLVSGRSHATRPIVVYGPIYSIQCCKTIVSRREVLTFVKLRPVSYSPWSGREFPLWLYMKLSEYFANRWLQVRFISSYLVRPEDVPVIRPHDIVVGGLKFYRDSSSIFFFSSPTLRARWTELNQNWQHVPKWVRFENACLKSGASHSPKSRRPKTTFLGGNFNSLYHRKETFYT